MQARSLKTVLRELEGRFGVYFNFDEEEVGKQTVKQPLTPSGNLEESLQQVLTPLHLRYEKVGEKYYSIFLKRPRKSPREMPKKAAVALPDRQENNGIPTIIPQGLPPGSKAVLTISGKVTDDNEQRLPGVNVVLKGSTTGTTTNPEGRYSLSIPDEAANGTLVFSFIGYNTEEVPISNRTAIDVVLVPDIQSLSEVVVTGYTSQSKKDITGSVSVVNVKELTANPGSNVESLLQGRAAGVTVTTSGVPGAGANVRIHGFSTFGNNEPLYIVDGTRVSSIADLNPNDIESMQVLKDASAASIYGSAAAGGVIVITTKRGASGVPKVSYDAYYGVQYFNRGFDLMNTEEFARYKWQSLRNAGQLLNGNPNHPQFGNGPEPVIPDYILAGNQLGLFNNPDGTPPAAADPANYKLNLLDVNGPGTYLIVPANKQGTDWLKEVLQTAPITSHQLTLSGGTDKGNYLLGLNYFDQDGIVVYTNYKRYSLRANSNFTIKNRVRVGENLQLNYILDRGFDNQREGNAILMAARTQPIIPVYNINGDFAGTRGLGLGNARNPVADAFRSKDNRERRIGIIGSVYGEFDFLKAFTFRTNLGMDYVNRNGFGFGYPSYENSEGRGGTGSFSENLNYGYTLTWYNTLNFKRTFGEAHSVNALVGTEVIQYQGRSVSAANNNYLLFDRNFWQVNAGLNIATGGSSEYLERLYSPIIARLEYSFRDKYLFSGSFRRDGSSAKFGPNNRYGNFPAVSAGWRISEEPFFKNALPWVSDLKLRAAYGILGNNAITSYGFLTLFSPDQQRSFYPITGTNSATTPGFRHTKIGNPDIRWEQTATINAGLDLSLWNNRLNVAVDLYNRKTTDLQFEQTLDREVYGLVDPQPVNVGSMTNKGIDLALNYQNALDNGFKYDASVTFSAYRNRVGTLADPFLEGGGTRIAPFTRSEPGRPIASFYGYQIEGFFQNLDEVNAIAEHPGKGVGRWRFKDVNGDGRVNGDDRTFIGNPHPDFTTGINLGAAFKNFDFSAFFYWKAGGDIANYTRFWTDFNSVGDNNKSRRRLYESWTPENPNAKLPITDANDSFSGSVPVSYYIEPGGYFRARNLVLGYSLPKAIIGKIGLDRLRVYVQGQNLFTITQYTGLDPEIGNFNTGRGNYRDSRSDTSLGIDAGNFPTPRSVLFGLNVGF